MEGDLPRVPDAARRTQPLLGGLAPEIKYGKTVLNGEFSRGSSKKPETTTLQPDSLRFGNIHYDMNDIIGAQPERGAVVVHAYPKISECCSGSTVARSYRPIRLYNKDQESCKVWARSISRLARGLRAEGKENDARKYLFYINPFSGSGQARKVYGESKLLFERAGIVSTVIETKEAGHVLKEIQSADLRKWDGIIIVSGDGLMNEYINGIMARSDWEDALRVPIGILPGGSGNGLSASIRKVSNEAMDTMGAAFAIAKGHTRDLDMISFNQPGQKPLYGMLSLSWGMIADIDLNSEACRCCGPARFTAYAIYRLCCLKAYYGRLRYMPASGGLVPSRADGISSLKASKQIGIISKQPEADTELGDESKDGMKWVEASSDVFTTIWAMSPPMPDEEHDLVPNAQLGDGKIHLTYLQGSSRCSALCGLLRMDDGTMTQDPDFKCIPVEKLILEPDSKRQMGEYSLDGEATQDNESWISMQIHPRTLNVFCGKESIMQA